MTTPTLTSLQWRKSSRSNDQGGNCVELAALAWQKSSRSGDQGGDCVELAPTEHTLVVGDTKTHATLALTLREITGLTRAVQGL